MKLTKNAAYREDHGDDIEASELVAFTAAKAEYSAEGSIERVRARNDALERILGRLVATMIDNGALRPDQVEMIFDYDVSAEA